MLSDVLYIHIPYMSGANYGFMFVLTELKKKTTICYDVISELTTKVNSITINNFDFNSFSTTASCIIQQLYCLIFYSYIMKGGGGGGWGVLTHQRVIARVVYADIVIIIQRMKK